MKVRIAQLIVTKNISENTSKINSVLQSSVSGEWVMFPEGMISGYSPEESDFLSKLDDNEINDAIKNISKTVREKKINCLVGSALKNGDAWYNCSIIITSDKQLLYRKNNLSTLDRNHFSAGNGLHIYEENSLKFGVQMCRELAFPEQWKALKKNGAQVIFHINNAIKKSDKVREQVLVARAFENQVWVCSVNNATSPQTMSSMIIDPLGNLIWKSIPQKEEVHVQELNMSLVSTQYLQQERTDLVDVVLK